MAKPPITVIRGKSKPDLIVHAADKPATARAAAQLLAVLQPPRLFQRGDGAIAYVAHTQDGAELRNVTRDHLISLVHEYSQPVRRTEKGRVETSFPDRAADLMFVIPPDEWPLPAITGVTSGPVVRLDGSIRTAPGFDAESGLFICDSPDLQELKVPENPIGQDARTSLHAIRRAFRTHAFADRKTVEEQFKFKDAAVVIEVVDIKQPPGLDESAYLHMLLTAPLRATLWLAPAFVFRSPSISGSGVGKGMLAKAPSLIAFGELPLTASLGNKKEFDKGLVGALRRGGHSLMIDNVNNRTLRSDTGCTALSDRPAYLRTLGSSTLVPLNSSMLISITGCGLDVGRDLIRRTVTIDLDAKQENPEQRVFPDGFLADIKACRVELLQHLVTIARWGLRNPQRLKHGKPFGSYEQWTHAVRDVLFTLGCPDPVERLAARKASDPERISIFDVFEEWWRRHGADWVTAHALDTEVKGLLLRGATELRQRIAYAVRQLLKTRIGDYLLLERKQGSKWAATKFRLVKTDEEDAHELIREAETPEEAESPAPAVPATPETVVAADFDDWQEPEPPSGLAPPAAPDPLSPEGKVLIWKNAFAPLTAATEPCPGWRTGDWPRTHAAIKYFLNGPLALAAAKAGWSALDLFAVHVKVGVAASHCTGALIGNLNGGFVAQVERDGTIRFTNNTVARKRELDPAACVPIWNFQAPKNEAPPENRFRTITECPAGTPCLVCNQIGNVKRIKDTRVVGGKSETLHLECAAAWFDRARASNPSPS